MKQNLFSSGMFNRWLKYFASIFFLSVICASDIMLIQNDQIIENQTINTEEFNYVNIYIHQSEQIRVPIAQYNQSNFPLKGPFLCLTPWISIFIDQSTSQTIFYSSQDKIYLLPWLIDLHNRSYSIGELIHYGYASLISEQIQQNIQIDISEYIHQIKLDPSEIPEMNSLTDGFQHGIQTQDEYFNISSNEQISTENDKSTKINLCQQNQNINQLNEISNENVSLCKVVVETTSNFCRINAIDKIKRRYLSSKLPTIEIEENENDESEIDETTEIEQCQCQQSILKPSVLFEHALFIILHLSNKQDQTVKNACRMLIELKEEFLQLYPNSNLELTLGFGYNQTQQWLSQANIPFPKSFIPFEDKCGIQGRCMPNTDGDIFVDIRSSRKDLCFHLGRQFSRLISTQSIVQLQNTFAFAYMSSDKTGLAKDFTGFEDGNDNPQGYQNRVKAALIQEQDDEMIHVGGSFALTQMWKHNLTKWNLLSKKQQEKIIGRSKGDNSVEFEPRLETSHVGRVHIQQKDVEIEILRKSLPFGDLTTHGLFFLGFASNPIKHEKLLNSMIGNRNGFYDRLMDFSTPITGNYWFIPSKAVIDKLFYSN